MANLSPLSYGQANDVIFVGPDYLFAGQLDKINDSAVIWKNGTRQLPYAIGTNTWLSRLGFNAPDLYAVGSVGGWAAFFRNSNYTSLSVDNSDASGIAFKGDDVYISGYVNDSNGNANAVYWKNGVLTMLANKYSYAVASGIAIAGDDVYIIGTIYEDFTYKAVYWKNGIQVQLSPSGNGYAIVVSK